MEGSVVDATSAGARVAADDSERLLADFPEPERAALREILDRLPLRTMSAPPPFGGPPMVSGAFLARVQVVAVSDTLVTVVLRDELPTVGMRGREVYRFFLEGFDEVDAIRQRHGCAGPPALQVGSVQTVLLVFGWKRRCVLASPPVAGEEAWSASPAPDLAAFPPTLQPGVRDLLASYATPEDSDAALRILASVYGALPGAALVEAEVEEIRGDTVMLSIRSDAPAIRVFAGQRDTFPWTGALLEEHRRAHGLPGDAGLRPGTVQVLLVVLDRVPSDGLGHGVVVAAPPVPR